MGIGGGLVLVPILILLFGFQAHRAVGTSAAVAIFSGLSSAAAYFKQKRVDWRVALALELVTAPGAFLGATSTKFISSSGLEALFAAFLLFLAYYMWRGRGEGRNPSLRLPARFAWERKVIDVDGISWRYKINVAKVSFLSFFAGFLAGFFGIGGGVMKVPVLFYSGTPIHIAIATSSFMVFITSSSSAIGHFLLGNIEWGWLAGLVPGVLIGTQLGAKAAKKSKPKMLRRSFAIILALMAVLMLVRGLGLRAP